MKSLMLIISRAVLLSILLTGCSARGTTKEEEPGYRQIPQEEAAAMMEKEDGHIILDVRRPDEYASGHIPGAICIPNETITTQMLPQLPDPDQIILVYCRSGNRSKQASEKLAEAGYKNVYEFGGIIDWTGEIITGDDLGGNGISEEDVTENN